MKAINGGLNLGSEFNPEKLCSEMKGISAGLNWMRVPVQPRKVRFRDENHQWGLNLVSEFNPEKLCLEMKGTSGGLNQDVGSSSTPKSEVQR